MHRLAAVFVDFEGSQEEYGPVRKFVVVGFISASPGTAEFNTPIFHVIDKICGYREYDETKNGAIRQ